MLEKISIIVPAYNAGLYLAECMESVLIQTHQSFELIVVNDGSTDDTQAIATRYSLTDSRVHVVSVINGGQGRARNFGLNFATGKYILFLDADDTLERTALQTVLQRIENDDSDFALFSFKYFRGATQKFNNTERFFGERILEGREQVNRILDCKAYFSVTRLYKKEFLDTHNIKFAEGHLYEDNPFITEAVLCANRVSIIHSPLYNVRVHSGSSTKTDTDTRKHCDDYISAVRKCVDLLLLHNEDASIETAKYYYTYYATRRFMRYYYDRVPKSIRNEFLDAFLDALSKLGDFPILYENDKFLAFCKKNHVFVRKRKFLLRMLTFYMRKGRTAKKRFINKIKKQLQTKDSGSNITIRPNARKDALEIVRQSNTILFIGFDHRYTGNSRYLFESLLQRYKNDTSPNDYRMVFATNSTLVDDEHRISPDDPDFLAELSSARILVFESWIPKSFKKQPGQYWIQLWHGLPFKKMLFDSEEKAIFSVNPQSKNNHYADIRRWNYLVAESSLSSRIFETAFLVPQEKILLSQYPRVNYLITNKNNESLRNTLSKKFSLNSDKKIVLYLPTWRDYNYGRDESQMDFTYLLDTDKLQGLLGDDYLVISKDHSYLHNKDNVSTISPDDETQELLIIADYVITDYSSVLFDAFAANIQVLLYITDFDKFDYYRGVYQEIWNVLQPLTTDNCSELASMIKNDSHRNTNELIRKYFVQNNIPKHAVSNLIHRLLLKKNVLPSYIFTISQAENIRETITEIAANPPFSDQKRNILFLHLCEDTIKSSSNLTHDFSKYGIQYLPIFSIGELSKFEKELVPTGLLFTSKELAETYCREYPAEYRDAFVWNKKEKALSRING